jgi:hypothetical protein
MKKLSRQLYAVDAKNSLTFTRTTIVWKMNAPFRSKLPLFVLVSEERQANVIFNKNTP